ncbi:MAG: histidine phosphatase family protein [Bacteroidales bacterium]|nr:histidine phosphatase family protein [Bacteroidales bacterium]
MKNLYIIRHAKSSWELPALNDHQRPIINIGKKRTEKVIELLKREGIKIDLLMTSDATRAYETACLLAEGLDYQVTKIIKNKKIYHADEDALFEIIFSFPDDLNNIIIVGHNPTLTEFVNYFIKPRIDTLPTSGVVSLSFDTISWSKITDCPFHLNFVLSPKKI